MDNLEFEEESHVYKLNGRVIPSVTTIMEVMTKQKYDTVNEDIMEQARKKGTAVHFAIELYNKTGYIGIEDCYKGYLDAYQEWVKNHNINRLLIQSETQTYSKGLWYSGTIDLIYNNQIIIDIKTTSELDIKSCAVQLSAYQKALESQNKDISIKDRYILWLKQDGTYKFIKLEDKFNIFLSCLQIYNYIKED